jgi:hypothetical protein
LQPALSVVIEGGNDVRKQMHGFYEPIILYGLPVSVNWWCRLDLPDMRMDSFPWCFLLALVQLITYKLSDSRASDTLPAPHFTKAEHYEISCSIR